MFAHTAAKRRIANVTGSVTLHPKKCNKARQNRILPSVTSKTCRASFPNECDFFTFPPFPSSLFLSFLTFFHFSHLLQ